MFKRRVFKWQLEFRHLFFTQGGKNGDVISKEIQTLKITLFDAALYFIFSFYLYHVAYSDSFHGKRNRIQNIKEMNFHFMNYYCFAKPMSWITKNWFELSYIIVLSQILLDAL